MFAPFSKCASRATARGAASAWRHARRGARALVVDLCDSLEHMRANERNGFSQMQLAKFAGMLVERPSREFYDVAVAKGVGGSTELLRSVD
jgi:hypothetical protein